MSWFSNLTNKDEKDKVTFADVLKGIITSMVEARAGADAQSVKIAQMYRSDKFMQSLSAPRFRIEEATVEFPVILKDIVKGSSLKIADTKEIVSKVLKSLDSLGEEVNKKNTLQKLKIVAEDKISKELLDDFHEKSGKKIEDEIFALLNLISKKEFKDSFQSRLTNSIEYFKSNMQMDISLGLTPSDIVVITDIQNSIRKTFLYELSLDKDLPDSWKNKDLKELTDNINEYITILIIEESSSTLLESYSINPNLDVSVVTENIKDYSSPDSIMKVNLKIKEEGMQWIRDHEEDKWHFVSE